MSPVPVVHRDGQLELAARIQEPVGRFVGRQHGTLAAGVPTIWMGVLPLLDGRDVSSLQRIVCGGSAVPKSLSEGFREKTGLPILQAWGMTETSPIASVSRLSSCWQ